MKQIKIWNLYHSVLLILATTGLVCWGVQWPLIILPLLSFTVLIAGQRKALARYRPYGGYANWVTLFRFLLVTLLAALFPILSDWLILVVAILSLILDGIDGYLARKHNQITALGAYFDMETDAYFTIIICAVLFLTKDVPVWILLIGCLRYIYVLLLYLLKWQHRSESSTYWAKLNAVILFVSLLMPFAFPTIIYQPMLILTSISTVISFGISFSNMARNG